MSLNGNAALPIGARLGEYRIEMLLGAGAFGITYKASDTNLGMPVAIKEFYPNGIVGRDDKRHVIVTNKAHEEVYDWGLERFIGEAQVMGRFKHPNIMRVVRYFTACNTGYIVMEFEQGQSLGVYLKALDAAPDEATLRAIFFPLLSGLQELHDKDILHRDIKPGNIYLRENNSPVLLDFGAARMAMNTNARDIATIVTPGYSPWEQYQKDANQGPWTDVYALGGTLYRCITGQPPADACSRNTAIRDGRPDPMSAAASVAAGRYSDDFLAAIDNMLSPHWEDRPRSTSDVLKSLEVQVDQEHSVSLDSLPLAGLNVRVRSRDVANHKLIITGPVGAGKTTAIRTLSDSEPVSVEAATSDMTHEFRNSTTVGMDYGVMELSQRERLHLYGTPGQERFDFMWDILKKGAIGLILLIDNSRGNPFRDLEFFLHSFRDLVTETKVAIGVSRMESASGPTITEYNEFLLQSTRGWSFKAPVFSVDTRSNEDLSILVQALLCSIDPGIDDYGV